MTGLQIHERPSPNHDARPAGQAVDILLLHYTGMESGEAALARMCDPEAKVSAHYCVEEDGRVFQRAGIGVASIFLRHPKTRAAEAER